MSPCPIGINTPSDSMLHILCFKLQSVFIFSQLSLGQYDGQIIPQCYTENVKKIKTTVVKISSKNRNVLLFTDHGVLSN